jgi:hypothetical protein
LSSSFVRVSKTTEKFITSPTFYHSFYGGQTPGCFSYFVLLWRPFVYNREFFCLSSFFCGIFVRTTRRKKHLTTVSPPWSGALISDFRKFIDIGHGAVAEPIHDLSVGTELFFELVEFLAVLTADVIIGIFNRYFLKRILGICRTGAAVQVCKCNLVFLHKNASYDLPKTSFSPS